jgi:hypothetical protein
LAVTLYRYGHRIVSPASDSLFSGSMDQIALNKFRVVDQSFKYQFKSAIEEFVAAFGRGEDATPLLTCFKKWHNAMPFRSDKDYILMRDSLDEAIVQYRFK